MCSKKKICKKELCKNRFEKSFSSNPKSKYWSIKNGDINPSDVYKGSYKKYWFNCDKTECGHIFYMSLSKITINNRWCPYCANQKLCDNSECSKCNDKSFSSNPKSIFWSNINEKQPRQVFKRSETKYWFNCDKTECGHIFNSSLYNISKGSWCSFCNNKNLCEDDNCKQCYDKSFSSNSKSIYWNEKNKKTPRQVFKNSNNKYWFNCEKCGHVFECILYSITSGSWCLYCDNKKLCDDNNCKKCYDKSFSSNPKSIFWSDKNSDIKPRQVFKSTHTKYWFKCVNNHEFKSSLSNITSGTWCPYCKHKTEKKLYDILNKIFPSLECQFKVEWCKNKNKLPYDFVLKEHKIIIELDGLQHFKQVGKWKSPEEILERDKYKELCANKNGYSVIRILQEDVLYDIYDWIKEISEHINEIIKKKEIRNVYMCKNNEYVNHK